MAGSCSRSRCRCIERRPRGNMQVQILRCSDGRQFVVPTRCRNGPSAIRQAWRRYAEFGNAATESGLEIGGELTIVDLGDVAIREDGSDHAAIVAAAERAARIGLLLSVGGDHSVTFPLVEGRRKCTGRSTCCISTRTRTCTTTTKAIRVRTLVRSPGSWSVDLRTRLVQVGVRTLEQAQPRAGAAVRCRGRRMGRIHSRDGADSCRPAVRHDRSRRARPGFRARRVAPEPAGLSVRDIVAGACPHPYAGRRR